MNFVAERTGHFCPRKLFSSSLIQGIDQAAQGSRVVLIVGSDVPSHTHKTHGSRLDSLCIHQEIQESRHAFVSERDKSSARLNRNLIFRVPVVY